VSLNSLDITGSWSLCGFVSTIEDFSACEAIAADSFHSLLEL
jgi:hypothetical protein